MLFLIYAIITPGCGLLHPPQRQNGYLVSHFNSCGPVALQDALFEYSIKNKIQFKHTVNAKEMSIEIQDKRKLINLRELLTLLDKEAAAITWPWEIKGTLNVRGITVREVSSIEELDDASDIAIILVHKKGTLDHYHWLTYPKHRLMHFGDKTIIDKIFLLEPIK